MVKMGHQAIPTIGLPRHSHLKKGCFTVSNRFRKNMLTRSGLSKVTRSAMSPSTRLPLQSTNDVAQAVKDKQIGGCRVGSYRGKGTDREGWRRRLFLVLFMLHWDLAKWNVAASN